MKVVDLNQRRQCESDEGVAAAMLEAAQEVEAGNVQSVLILMKNKDDTYCTIQSEFRHVELIGMLEAIKHDKLAEAYTEE